MSSTFALQNLKDSLHTFDQDSQCFGLYDLIQNLKAINLALEMVKYEGLYTRSIDHHNLLNLIDEINPTLKRSQVRGRSQSGEEFCTTFWMYFEYFSKVGDCILAIGH